MKLSRFVRSLLLIIALLAVHVAAQQKPSGTAKRCIKVTSIIAEVGDGSTSDSCMGCDPALPSCAPKCQDYIDSMYVKCDGVCMPDGYFYDPLSTITGCWEDVKPLLKIGVERCGCNSAFSNSSLAFSVVVALSLLCSLLLF